jgi:hypothetical protein
MTISDLEGVAVELDRVLELRAALSAERQATQSPAVARALQMADYYLFLSLGYLGYTERLFPEQD